MTQKFKIQSRQFNRIPWESIKPEGVTAKLSDVHDRTTSPKFPQIGLIFKIRCTFIFGFKISSADILVTNDAVFNRTSLRVPNVYGFGLSGLEGLRRKLEK
jgi:hypothetical protein